MVLFLMNRQALNSVTSRIKSILELQHISIIEDTFLIVFLGSLSASKLNFPGISAAYRKYLQPIHRSDMKTGN